jgi:hypothetical protein
MLNNAAKPGQNSLDKPEQASRQPACRGMDQERYSQAFDAISQILFSAGLIADVLPRIWERNPQEGQRRLNELRQLTLTALTELRSLILESHLSTSSDRDEPGNPNTGRQKPVEPPPGNRP